MNAILISIQPQWVEKILNGEKTIEIRKTIPKCKLPCKVYIYCTKAKNRFDTCVIHNKNKERNDYSFCEIGNGKVVAEFTLNQADEFSVFENGSVQYWNCYNLEKSCLTYEQIAKYIGYDKKYGYKNGYAWFIDNLKIYDKPKELSEFQSALFNMSICVKSEKNNKSFCRYCCKHYNGDFDDCGLGFHRFKQLTRPPQSWCYVNDLEENYEL